MIIKQKNTCVNTHCLCPMINYTLEEKLVGKKNLVTMSDKNGVTLRYTCRQRMFEGKLLRYREVLEREKSKHSVIKEEETALSAYSRKTNDLKLFEDYLKLKKIT